MNKLKHKIIKFTYPKNVYDIATSLHFIMKITGIFPLKIKKTKFGRCPVFCKWGILTTIFYLIIYFCCLFHVCFYSLPKMKKAKKLDSEIVVSLSHYSQFLIETFATLIIMISIFPLIKFEKYIYETLDKIEVLATGLDFDYKATIKRGRILMATTSLIMIGVFITGAFLTIYGSGDFNTVDFLFVVIYPHLTILIKVVSFMIYVSILNIGFIELKILMENTLKCIN